MLKKLVFVFLFYIGILFRLWFTTLTPHDLIGDQYVYDYFARGILQNGIFAMSDRVYGYPLILVTLYKLFGSNNINNIYLIQAIIDTLTAFMILIIGKVVFRKPTIAWISFFLYLFNPFSSAYTGVLLTEVWAIFIIILISLLAIYLVISKKKLFFFMLILFLGFLPQVRPSFFIFSIGAFSALLLLSKILLKSSKWVFIYSVSVLLFSLSFLYSVMGNLKYYDQFSPLTADNLFVRELYLSMFVGRHVRGPLINQGEKVVEIFNELTPLPKNSQERREIADKYFKIAVNEFSKNPASSLIHHIKKMWYVWEKYYIFYYYKSFLEEFPFLPVIYFGNLFIFIGGNIGIIIALRHAIINRKNQLLKLWFSGLSLYVVIYITLMHVISMSEQRFSLPGYPFLLLFFSYFINELKTRLLPLILRNKHSSRIRHEHSS